MGKVVILNIDSKPISVFCHKKIDGCGDGGWTPVMKIDGDKVLFFLQLSISVLHNVLFVLCSTHLEI